jgi:hypothetical protein
MNSIFVNWKTSAAGVATIICGVGIAIYSVAENQPDNVKVGVGLVAAGLVGLFAKDGAATPSAAAPSA